MSKPSFNKLPVSLLVEKNKPAGDLPIIGVCFDYRATIQDPTLDSPAENFEYFEFLFEAFTKCVEKAGGQIFVIAPNEKPENLRHLDGLIIPGGRDMDPIHYNQEKHEKTSLEPDAALHFFRNKQFYEGLSCPVMGICWGMEFLNVYHGGDLEQHLPQAEDHLNKVNAFIQKPGSFLAGAISEKCEGFCYHHQGVGKLAPGFEITSTDQAHGLPHGIEKIDGERKVFGVIWHPEKVAVEDGQVTANNLGCFEALVKLAVDFRRNRKDEKEQ